MKNKPSGDFLPGMRVKQFTLIKWLKTNENGEQWLVKSPLSPLGTTVYLNRTVEVKQAYSPLPDRHLSEGMMFHQWQLKKFITRATTAEIWLVNREQDPNNYVIKIATSDQHERVQQVIKEVQLLQHLHHDHNVISLVDYDLETAGSFPWFVVPWADTLYQYLGKKADSSMINHAVQQFIDIINELAQQLVFYPDIQLEHLRYVGQQPVLIDFGAAIYPADKFIVDGKLLPSNSQNVAAILQQVLVSIYDNYQIKLPSFLQEVKVLDLIQLRNLLN